MPVADLPQSEALVALYRAMARIRVVEETLLAQYAAGRVRGTVHTCLGQEAAAVGAIGALDPSRDTVCSNHRGHGHYLAFTGDLAGLIAEILGRPVGVCEGIGGSQHLHRGGFYSNGILGGMAPVAAGMALAAQARGDGGVAAVCLGDGALGEGIVYETFNLAALWRLPLLFVVEANGWAQSTPTVRGAAGELADRATPFGIPVADIDGNDVAAVRAAASAVVRTLREGSGPQVLFLRTYRLGPHSKGDDHRDPHDIAAARARDPLAITPVPSHVRQRALADARAEVDAVLATLDAA